jgi:glycosyltransferase involved in cell wall biosynthesis
MPRISVIIPSYNHSRYLRQRIDSILNQSFQNFELIILDDCSTDNSRAVIEEYAASIARIRTLYNSVNFGFPCRQWDLGVANSNGEYVWICESDDYAEPEFLEKAVSVLDKHENVGLVYCDATAVDERTQSSYLVSKGKSRIDNKKWKHDYINEGRAELSGYLYLNNLINNVSGVLFRKETYMQAGQADKNMKYCGDWFLYCRMLLISDIAYISQPLNTIRYHSGSTSNKYYIDSAYPREMARIYRFVNQEIALSLSQQLNMTRNIARILANRILRNLIHIISR